MRNDGPGGSLANVRGAHGDEVVGFYTLVVAQVEYEDAPQRLGKGLAKHPIPLMLLARLAVATSWHGKGLEAMRPTRSAMITPP